MPSLPGLEGGAGSRAAGEGQPLGGTWSAERNPWKFLLAQESWCHPGQIPRLSAQAGFLPWPRGLEEMAAGVLGRGCGGTEVGRITSIRLALTLAPSHPWAWSDLLHNPLKQVLLSFFKERMRALVREVASDPPGKKWPIAFQAG